MKKCFNKIYEAEGQHIDEERRKRYYAKINEKSRIHDGIELKDESITAGLKSKSKNKKSSGADFSKLRKQIDGLISELESDG